MTSSLKLLLEAIDRTPDEQDLRSQIVPQIGAYFAAKRGGIFFFDQLFLNDPRLQKTLSVALSLEHNPVAKYLVERHTPVHEALVTSPKTWRMICPRPDHWHVMAGPIIDRNQLVGAVGCTRDRSMPAFDTPNLVDLSAVCLHLSVWAVTVRGQGVSPGVTDPANITRSQSQPTKTDFPWNGKVDRLTPRELQIAELVALGRTNKEIGNQLWITENSVKQALKRMFRKLEVSSRAEMVAQLAATAQSLKDGVTSIGNEASM
ncbi:LuxR C-terminal-related transcriptional regulator [Kovacikia minuta CCNUW1]|uniref:LuxR C-terminal-related transcriptional regulator n=1 Tax=Kovacikia minuta TaxID=2931930 RepID=UPI001CCD9B7B|nr:LuxR C-terminal-related transcriptional regulator [Kovacikia minuta]UBF25637.1 LuxR C-terminal-related transcriptional regulator [Kovacikia minuta CCNUW1]